MGENFVKQRLFSGPNSSQEPLISSMICSEELRPFPEPNSSEEFVQNFTEVANSSNGLICCACQKPISNKSNLKKHAKRFHPDRIAEIVSEKVLEFKCNHCNRQFSSERDLKYHMNASHDIINLKPHICPECKPNFHNKDILMHLKNEHNFTVKEEEKVFATFDHFLQWKCSMEKKSVSKYVYRNSTQKKDGVTYLYICHRSGIYSSKGKGIRRLKMKGSNKINFYCPAKIRAFEKNDGSVSVTYSNSHFGHENDLGHLTVTLQGKKSIAGKLATNIPSDSILDDLRNSVAPSGIKRKIREQFDSTIIVQELSSERNKLADDELTARKKDAIEESNQVLDSLTTHEQLDKVENFIKYMYAVFSTPLPNYDKRFNDSNPSKENIIPQRKKRSVFHS